MAIESYDGKPDMYGADLVNGLLVVSRISPHIYMRIGTEGLGATPMDAIYALRKRIMTQFEKDLQCVWWQSKEYGGKHE